MDLKKFKLILIAHCEKELQKNLLQQKERLSSLKESLAGETKSSAGDKHETGRAMVQLEMEKSGERLRLLELQFETFKKIAQFTGLSKDTVRTGHLVAADEGLIYINTSLGILECEGVRVMAISAETPLAGVLLGKKVGATGVFNGKSYRVLNFC